MNSLKKFNIPAFFGVLLVAGFASSVLAGCEVGESNSFTDPRDGQTYKTVKIGNQVWMAENLNYEVEGSHYYWEENYIHLVEDEIEGSACYKDKDCSAGRLYRRKVADKVCPTGWHLPSDAEWETLVASVGGWNEAAKALKADSVKIPGVVKWPKFVECDVGYKKIEKRTGYGTDAHGFRALPGGMWFQTHKPDKGDWSYKYRSDSFSGKGLAMAFGTMQESYFAEFWSASFGEHSYSRYVFIDACVASLRTASGSPEARSIRCIKNAEPQKGDVVDESMSDTGTENIVDSGLEEEKPQTVSEPRGVLKLLTPETKKASEAAYELMKKMEAEGVKPDKKNHKPVGIGDGLAGLLDGKGSVEISGHDVHISRDGSRSSEDIMKVVRRCIPGLRFKYDKFLETKPGLQGKVVLKITIDPEGLVDDISIVSSNTGSSEFDGEIKTTVSRWKFSKVEDGYDWVTIPIIFGE